MEQTLENKCFSVNKVVNSFIWSWTDSGIAILFKKFFGKYTSIVILLRMIKPNSVVFN